MTPKPNPHDLVEHAKYELHIYQRVSKLTSEQLIAEVERLRELIKDIGDDAKERDMR